MRAFALLALASLLTAGCTYHSETVVQKPVPSTAVVVPDSPPPTTTVIVPSD